MVQPTETAADLIALLDANREEIATAWLDAIRQHMPDSVYVQRPAEEIYANNLLCINWFKRILSGQTPQVSWWQEAGQEVMNYVQMGLHFSEVVEAGLLFSGVIHPFVRRIGGRSPAVNRQAFARIDECVHEFVNSLASWYMDLTDRHVQEQQQRTALMLEMVQVASSTLELDKVLAPIARGIAQAAGAAHCMLILVDDENTGTLWVATEELPASVMAGLEQNAHERFPLQNLSVARLALETKRPVSCCDALADPRMNPDTAQRLGIKSILAVPCVVQGRVVAVADVLVLDELRAFSEEQVELAWGVANAVAPAIENARLHQRIEYLAMAEERARLAREMHDELAQTLGAVQLKASLIGDLLSEDQVSAARTGTLELQEMISQAYAEVREAIFNLRATASPESEFLASLQEYLVDYRQHYGLDVALEADGEAAATLVGNTRQQVFRIIQEALTNARKHGEASKAWVRIERENGRVCIIVEDDGQGFDPSHTAQQDQLHFGLQVMRERAETICGSIVLDARPGSGTKVMLRLPWRPRQRQT
jgi:signal transduction histidine kinase